MARIYVGTSVWVSSKLMITTYDSWNCNSHVVLLILYYTLWLIGQNKDMILCQTIFTNHGCTVHTTFRGIISAAPKWRKRTCSRGSRVSICWVVARRFCAMKSQNRRHHENPRAPWWSSWTCNLNFSNWLGTVPVHKQTGCQYIIVSFGTGQCKFLISWPVQKVMWFRAGTKTLWLPVYYFSFCTCK